MGAAFATIGGILIAVGIKICIDAYAALASGKGFLAFAFGNYIGSNIIKAGISSGSVGIFMMITAVIVLITTIIDVIKRKRQAPNNNVKEGGNISKENEKKIIKNATDSVLKDYFRITNWAVKKFPFLKNIKRETIISILNLVEEADMQAGRSKKNTVNILAIQMCLFDKIGIFSFNNEKNINEFGDFIEGKNRKWFIFKSILKFIGISLVPSFCVSNNYISYTTAVSIIAKYKSDFKNCEFTKEDFFDGLDNVGLLDIKVNTVDFIRKCIREFKKLSVDVEIKLSETQLFSAYECLFQDIMLNVEPTKGETVFGNLKNVSKLNKELTEYNVSHSSIFKTLKFACNFDDESKLKDVKETIHKITHEDVAKLPKKHIMIKLMIDAAKEVKIDINSIDQYIGECILKIKYKIKDNALLKINDDDLKSAYKCLFLDIIENYNKKTLLIERLSNTSLISTKYNVSHSKVYKSMYLACKFNDKGNNLQELKSKLKLINIDAAFENMPAIRLMINAAKIVIDGEDKMAFKNNAHQVVGANKKHIKTNINYMDKTGLKRTVYSKNGKFYVKKKSPKTGKFEYKVVRNI